MEIVFLGTSCMVPTKERNHQGIFLFHDGEGILVDCGEGIQRQMKIADIKPTKVSIILITHWHGDHVLGLPGLLQTMNSNEYDKKLQIFGPRGTQKHFEDMFNAFSFKIEFEHSITEISNVDLDFKVFGVEAKELEHGVPCLGYSIKEHDKRRIKPAAVKKLGIPDGPLLGELQAGRNIEWKGKKVTIEDATFVVKGKKVAVVLDTILCNNVNALSKDADMLICEASYTSDLEKKAEEYKHMTAKQAGLVASNNNVKELILTHLSQRYKSPEETLQDAKLVFENVRVAFDFMKVKI
ncbi:MAG: ribonuclease Z [Candidatus Woesearchaeota archaeon]|nr:ribonuclease Z [Candidatus Woesearchaeota archaeon]